ncbi:hypothetical protein CCR75_006747 [Bremia lactucae]|uniref:Uncharacterized protein n=1 Tax=Bremia lactucae TaxID=4779 RepID=A0A976FK73_BRELC|nr:hypothetical protein CCR75_006747 [Bremia lactucae]
MTLIWLNYPAVFACSSTSAKARYTVEDYTGTSPRLLVLQKPEGLRLASGSGPTVHEEVLCTRLDIDRGVRLVFGDADRVTSVLPHPNFSCSICILVNHSRWTFTKAQFRNRIAERRNRIAADKADTAQACWNKLNSTIASGFVDLKSKHLWNIVGINAWGEQMIYRLKRYALSAYNPLTKRIDCPHSDCARVQGVDIYNTYSECALLRRNYGLCLPADGVLPAFPTHSLSEPSSHSSVQLSHTVYFNVLDTY